ncbi:MAG: HipA domain-containing protein [Treponema sp.]|nr:HipA domain-containing protein [Treponema sp.]
MRYALQNKDTVLIEFNLESDPVQTDGIVFNKIHCDIQKIHSDFAYIFPKNLTEITNESLMNWIHNRKAPNNRQNVNRILASFENSENPIIFLNITHSLSVKDTFWVNCLDKPLTWHDCNLYENSFNDILAHIAFAGYSKKLSGVISSPEFTTDGAQKKCWSKRDDGIFLIKGAAQLYDHPDRHGRTDVISEFLASQIADTMGLYHTKYNLEYFKHYDGEEELAVICKAFTNKDRGLLYFYTYAALHGIPVSDYNLSDYGNQLQYATLYGKEAFEDMMVFDSLIINTDRHMNNFGMLFDTNTGEILCPAPLYDHGNSLLVGGARVDLKNPDAYISTLKSQFQISFDEQAHRFMKSRHIPMLSKLKNFHFQPVDVFDCSADYFKDLEVFIQKRANHLIETFKKYD